MKSDFYAEIRKNKFDSAILMSLFIFVIVLIGFAFGYYYGDMLFFGLLFGFISIIIILIQYFTGDKLIRAMNGAKEADKKKYAYLVNTVEGLAIAAGLPIPKVYVIESEALNAFATGRNPEHASITVTSGLLKKLNREELEGVIAHEMSHIKNYDIRFMMLTAVLLGLIIMMSRIFIRSMWFSSGNRRSNNSGGAIFAILAVVGIVLAVLSPIFAKLIQLAISRKREFLADASGAMLTRYPPGLANALKKISKSNIPLKTADSSTAHLFISNPFNKKSFNNLFNTHPPVEERIKRLEGM